MHWPNRVWQLGDVNEDGRQLYWSHEPTKDDKKRREEWERDFESRRADVQS